MIKEVELFPLKLNPPLNVTYVQDGAGLVHLVKHLEKSDKIVGWDKETTPVKDFYTRRDRLWQIGDKNEQFVVDLLSFVDGDSKCLSDCQGSYGRRLDPRLSMVVDCFNHFLCTGDFLKVGVNLGFEYEQSYWNFGQRTWHFFSCDMVERLFKAGEHSLKDYDYYSMEQLVARYFKAQIDKSLQTSFNLTDPVTQAQIEYAALDVMLPLAIRKKQLEIIKRDGMHEISELENNAIGPFIDMHVHGLRMDEPKWNGIEEKNVNEFKTLIAEKLDPVFLPIVGSKTELISDERIEEAKSKWKAISLKNITPADAEKREALKKACSDLGKRRTKQRNLAKKCEGDALINYASGAQVLRVFETMPELKALKSTDDDDLSKFKNVPVVAAFRKYRELSKAIKTYGKTWTTQWSTHPCKEEGWLHPGDGRLHSHFNQLDAGTGRSTSSGPNDQNIPKAEECRACFIADPPDDVAPEGYDIITIDMSGAELRIVAELSGEKTWIDAFNRGEDVHEVCAEMMYKKEWPEWAASGCAYYALKKDGTPAHQKCKCPNHKDKRDDAKVPNFLLIYGGQAANLASQIGKTIEESQVILDKHKAAFPTLWNYLEESGRFSQEHRAAYSMFNRRRLFPEPTWDRAIERILEEAKSDEGSRWEKYMRKFPKAFGINKEKWTDALWENTVDEVVERYCFDNQKRPTKDQLYPLLHRSMPVAWQISSMMKSMFSRIERQGMNHPVQSTNADLIKLAMGAGHDKNGKPFLWHILPEYNARLLAMVHDELLIQSPKSNSEVVAELAVDAFKRAGAEKFKSIEMCSDYHIADHWQK